MKMKKILAAGVIFCMSTLLLCACGEQQQSASDKIHAGVICYNQSDTFLEQLITRFKEQLNELGGQEFKTTVTLRDAAGSQRTQNDQVKELIDAGCNVLCVNLVDRADPSEIIDLARDNDVPIIFFNREPVAEDLMQWDKLYYVGAEAKQSGVMQGELAADVIQANSQIDRNKDGKIQYVVLEGEPGHQDAIIRTENAVDTLKNKGIELEKLSYGIANWNRAQAQNRMLLLISQYQSKIELVLANNDDMALGAIDAYKKLNYSESALPVFFGVDGTDVGLQAILDSEMSGTVYNDKEGQAEAMAKLAVALVSGRGMEDIKFEKEKYIYLPYSKVTIDNVGDYLRKEK
ncbi:galactose ABC transporter substrate-binding protein [Blautia coccoides]|uniref:D-galactose/methyl-galactoside binding periplasmic protein MglB n=2 Tax=Blautia producta TaxID=33035 RepID=A0A7G5MRH4_9FIRM|nr:MULTISPECIES: galactose ABC transporter substrate-binding protein [Bacillota]MCR1988394.1 galactose ABC transporter substrate-binding protein [Blautia coccoides]MDU5222096.1 galactose ABC transporter substrate-binding protein [Blautia producta]MDU5383958.1 galactose ABC transporter substrate-binding protein [Blautia producta]MDU6825236.1 galactose ABC transporter substrate-binding protein [Streptococcus lutetiensis]MDU6884848.1 galactose ABC transporter substrate-binding protein [Blautia pr